MTLRVDPAHLVEDAVRNGNRLVGAVGHWERVSLGDVARVINGEPFPSHEFNSVGRGKPLIRIRDVARRWTETFFDGAYKEQSLVHAGDLLVGMDGDFAARRWEGSTALLNQRVCRIGVIDRRFYDPDFLLLCLPAYLDLIWENTPSVTVKHLSSRSLEKIPLPLPPLAEQRRVVDAVDELTSRVAAGREHLREATSRAACFRQSGRTSALLGATRSPGRLSEVIERIEAGRSGGGSAPGAKPYEWGVIKVSAMTWGEFKPGENKRVPDDFADPRFEIRSDDLLVSRANTADYVGAPVLVGEVRPKLLLSDKSLRIVPKAGIDRRWLLHSLASPTFRSYVTATATGTKDSMRNISQAALLAGPVHLVDPDQQRQIADEIDEHMASAKRLDVATEAAEERARQLHQSILEMAFSGRLVSQDPDDESASRLLHRMRAEQAAQARVSRPARRRSRG